ncbi:MMPL family protein, partial [Mycobacterium avium MAV_120809_2495]
MESYDHKSAYVQVNLRGDQGGAVGDKSVAAIRKIVADSKPPAGVKAYVAGQGALTADTIVVADASLAKMTIITIIIIAIMLMFVYRSIGTVVADDGHPIRRTGDRARRGGAAGRNRHHGALDVRRKPVDGVGHRGGHRLRDLHGRPLSG